jgi:inner membrane protein
MPTIFTHGFAAYTLSKVIANKTATFKLLLAVVICSMLPDADVIGFKFGIAYDSLFGHRGFTHSIVFALLLAFTVKSIFFKAEKIFSKNGMLILFVLFMSTLSHPLLDMLTNGGLGVALFSPFSNHRYFFGGLRPVQVSPIGAIGFFSMWGVRVLISEFIFIGLPCILTLLGVSILNSKSKIS